MTAREKKIWKLVLISLLLCAGATNLRAQDATASDWRMSPRLPHVQSPVEFSFPTDGGGGAMRLEIREASGEVVFDETANDGGDASFSWVPRATGYYRMVLRSSEEEVLNYRFPVVWRPIYIPVWPVFSLDDRDRFPLLTSTVIVTDEGLIDAWKQHGSTTLLAAYHRAKSHVDLNRDGEEMAQALADQWATAFEKGADGVFIDEFASYPDEEGLARIRIEARALQLLRERYPNGLIFPAQGGSLHRESALAFKRTDSIALLETYLEFSISTFGSHSWKRYVDQRVEAARAMDLIFERGYKLQVKPGDFRGHGAILLLSMNHVGEAPLEEPAVPRLERQVRYIKRTAPEMPGLGFYGLWRSTPYLQDRGLLEKAEELVERYYIRPVIDIRDVSLSTYEPKLGETVTIYFEIHNVGGMDARDVRIRLYARSSATNKRVEIGTQEVDVIGTGFATVRNDSDDLQVVERNQNRYVALPGHEHVVFLARHTAEVSWTPTEAGYHTVIAEIDHTDGQTVLNGRIEVPVLVRE